MRTKLLTLAALLLLFLSLPSVPASGQEEVRRYFPLVTHTAYRPVLKWAYGGCYSSWCETGWYSSPAVQDVNGDGRADVLASAYSLWALDGAGGATLWSVDPPGGRTWPGVVSVDLDQDGQNEIVVAQSGAWVSAYNADGSSRWQIQLDGGKGELRGLLAADLDGNGGAPEIVVTRAYGSAKNAWVLDASGAVRPGWPQLPQDHDNPAGYAWGVYNANAAAGDLLGDSRLELVVPSDVHYINAYDAGGAALPANPAHYPGKTWGLVGAWESLDTELRGWGACDGRRAESYRTNFADGPAALADLDGDGRREVIVTGNMVDCHTGYPPSRYMALYLFNPDRTRYNAGGHDWRAIPVDSGAPLSEDYNRIETALPNPVPADLDGDGRLEILFPSYDGRLHAFWLDKTEHGAWPYAVTQPGEGVMRFASEPVVVDIFNDGQAEVIFTSWAQKGLRHNGYLHIVDSRGRNLYVGDLPASRADSATWNGGLPAPTLANIDADPDLEIIILTASSGVVVYDLPESAGARILWGTGRGNFGRTGSR
jgi:hypothetical protein